MTEPSPDRRLRVVPSPRGIDREQGYAVGQTNWWRLWAEERTPELQWPHSVAVYDRMRRQDAQVLSVLRAVMFPVQMTEWRVDPAGASPEVAAFIADNLGLRLVGDGEETPAPRERDRFSWDQHLEWALLQVVFGHMFFEQVVRIDDDGMARLRKLAPRWPRTIQKINVARDGGLVSIEQPPLAGEIDPVVLPVTRLVAYVWEREGGNWTGRSLLRSCYKNWLLKDQVLRTWVQGIDRNAMGLPWYTGAEGETDLSKGEAIARGARGGETSGGAGPFGSTLKLLGVEGELIDPEKAVRYMDEQIGRSVLAHFLNLGTQTGSWALGSTFAEFFTGSLNRLAKSIATVGTQHIIEDLVDWNFGEAEPAPRITFTPIGQNTQAIVQAMKTLVDAGLIYPDPKLDAYARDVANLPARAPFDRPASSSSSTSSSGGDDDE